MSHTAGVISEPQGCDIRARRTMASLDEWFGLGKEGLKSGL